MGCCCGLWLARHPAARAAAQPPRRRRPPRRRGRRSGATPAPPGSHQVREREGQKRGAPSTCAWPGARPATLAAGALPAPPCRRRSATSRAAGEPQFSTREEGSEVERGRERERLERELERGFRERGSLEKED